MQSRRNDAGSLKDLFGQTLVSSIQNVLLITILILGCNPGTAPVRMPVFPMMRSEAIPHLIGVNHLFTIKGYFSRPMGIAADPEGKLYVADSGKSLILMLDEDGKLLESIGRFGWRAGEFDSPADVALDPQLRLYIADSGNNRVQRFGLSNGRFSVIAGEKDNNTAEPVLLSQPKSVAADIRGYIYIADTWNNRVLKIDPLGRLQMEISDMIKNPQGVAVDSKENIYISDTGNHRMQKLDFSGSPVEIWGEEGTAKGQFQNPTGQAIDRFGNIYVVDRGNKRVQSFNPAGIYLLEFGQQVLDDPVDIAIDNSFHAYVTDFTAGDIEVFKIIYETAGDAR